MSPSDTNVNIALVQAFVAAYNSGVVEEFARFWAPDTVFVRFPEGESQGGSEDENLAMARRVLQHVPDRRIEVKSLQAVGDTVVVSVEFSGTVAKAGTGWPPVGDRFSYSRLMVWQIVDDLIRSEHIYR